MNSASRSVFRGLLLCLVVLGAGALAACNGSALVTLTATAAQTPFLTYRVQLTSVTLQNSSGSTTIKLLPSTTTVDLAKLVNVSEIFGITAADKGNFTTAVVTMDFTNALIVADDGSAAGVTLKPLSASGQALGAVTMTLDLDGSYPLTVTKNQVSQLSLNFNLAASNVVDLSAATVTVTPFLAASAVPIDAKPVRVRGPLIASTTSTNSSSNTTSMSYTTGITPFDELTTGAGQLQVATSALTTYEINGTAASGVTGQTPFTGLATGTWTVAYGALTGSTTTSSTGATGTSSGQNVSFAATEVLAGSSVQGGGSDRVTGVVTAINGTALTLSSASLVTNGGVSSYLPGTTTVTVSANTAVTLPQQSSASVANTIAQISIGSIINAFGTATTSASGTVSLDATSGRVRLVTTSASGTVTVQGTGQVTVDLGLLGGRDVAPFNFAGTGGSSGKNSQAASYVLATGALDLTNAIAGAPVVVTGLVTPYGSAGTSVSGTTTPDFIASTLLDSTTIQAELVVDWGSGTPTPFNAYSSTQIDLLSRNSSIGLQHTIQYGSQSIDFTTLPSDVLIVPSSSTSAMVYSIAHASTSTIDNYNTFADFITALQSDLNGTTVATGMTVQGVYTTTSYTLTATNVTIALNI